MTIETELPAVKVRELEWQPDGDRKYRAKSAIGPYIICPGTGFFYNLAGPVGGRLSTHKRLDDAFLAAQADYERRILSALVPSAALKELGKGDGR